MLHVPEAFILMLVLETQCHYQLVLIADWSQRIGCTTHFQNTKRLDQSISVLVLIGNMTVYIPEKGDESCAHKEKKQAVYQSKESSVMQKPESQFLLMGSVLSQGKGSHNPCTHHLFKPSDYKFQNIVEKVPNVHQVNMYAGQVFKLVFVLVLCRSSLYSIHLQKKRADTFIINRIQHQKRHMR